MKGVLLSLIIVSGCSTWKQKDFEKDLNKPTEEAAPVAASKKEEKILEKFEVQQVEPTKVEPALPKKDPPLKMRVEVKQNPKKPDEKPVAKIIAEPVTTPAMKPLPEKYPESYIAINEKAKKVWNVYKPNHIVDQKIFLDIHYLGMTVGKIMVMNKGKKMINGKEVWHFHARFKSSPFYSNIYELDETVDTYVTTEQFLSNRYSLVQRESKQNVDDLQLHDRDQYKTFWFYKRTKSDGYKKEKKEVKPIPYFSTDPFSVLFFYQGLPLKNGDIYEIPLINKGKVLILRSEIEGREAVETEQGTRNAIRVHATTKYTGETLKSGDLYFWFSDDSKRVLLKAQAKIKIGSVTADIVDK